MNKIKLKKCDYLVIIFIALLGLISLWFNLQQVGASNRKYVSIYVENNLVVELSADLNDSYHYSFDFGENSFAEIEIAKGRVRMLPLSDELCLKGICSHTGWIASSHESIVCLPNRIMVTIAEKTDSRDDIDGITY